MSFVFNFNEPLALKNLSGRQIRCMHDLAVPFRVPFAVSNAAFERGALLLLPEVVKGADELNNKSGMIRGCPHLPEQPVKSTALLYRKRHATMQVGWHPLAVPGEKAVEMSDTPDNLCFKVFATMEQTDALLLTKFVAHAPCSIFQGPKTASYGVIV